MSLAALAALTFTTAPTLAQGAEADDRLRFTVTPYLWLASVDSDIDFRGNTQTVSLSAGDILKQFNFGFMGLGVIEKGRFGLVTDVVYARLSDDATASRDLIIGNEELPANVTANLDLETRMFILTLAPRLRLVDEPNFKLNVLAGTRHFYLRQSLDYTLSGNAGDIPLPDRQGDLTAAVSNWDLIAGISGEYAFGPGLRWFVPFGYNMGGGDSDFTWEGLAGLGYRFGWGDLLAVYRTTNYELSGQAENYRQQGPAIGATFRF